VTIADPRAAALAAWHNEWIRGGVKLSADFQPVEGNSQQPETEEDMWPDQPSDDIYWTGVERILNGDTMLDTVTATALLTQVFGGPAQARIPKGNRNGGEWMDTPGGLADQAASIDVGGGAAKKPAAKRKAGRGTREDVDRSPANRADPETLKKARDLAVEKYRAAPVPTDEDRRIAHERHARNKRQGGDDRPGAPTRRRLKQKLVDQFGDGKTCPCVACGVKLTPDQVSMDRIIPGSDNGRYKIDNLIPMDYECNQQRSNTAFTEMRDTWAAAPLLEPAAPLGTMVRARLAGWDEVQADDYVASYEQGLDILPTYDGIEEWQEGALEGWPVDLGSTQFFQHVVNGNVVDASTVTALGGSGSGITEP
jgi:hypothetical protein